MLRHFFKNPFMKSFVSCLLCAVLTPCCKPVSTCLQCGHASDCCGPGAQLPVLPAPGSGSASPHSSLNHPNPLPPVKSPPSTWCTLDHEHASLRKAGPESTYIECSDHPKGKNRLYVFLGTCGAGPAARTSTASTRFSLHSSEANGVH